MPTAKTAVSLGLLGQGRIYQTLKQHLSDAYDLQTLQQEALPGQMDQYQIIILCYDSWSAVLREETQALGQMRQVAWLPIYSEFDSIFIGPLTKPGTPGCFTCAEQRRQRAISDIELFRQSRERIEQDSQRAPQPWLTCWGLGMISSFIKAELATCLQLPQASKVFRAVLKLNLATLQWSYHHFLPDPACAVCGNLPSDSAEAAHLQLQSRPQAAPGVFRTRSLSQLTEQIVETYVDQEYGLIHQLGKPNCSLCAMTTAYAGMEYQGRHRKLTGIGRTLSYKQSYLSAIAEALERYGGQLPQGRRTVVQASFRQLGAQALNPSMLGLPTPDQYMQSGNRYVPYHQDLVCNWVWAYSFGQRRPLLVPEFYAYYGYPDKQAFAFEISNGCALGSCLEEAILYGLLEILERDAFLLTWYGQLGVPQIDLSSIPDQRIRWLIEHLEYRSGYSISLFNTTLLHRAPCCWVMAIDERQRSTFPRMVCTAGSHLLPEEALLGALLELAPMLSPENLQEQFQAGRQRALEMLDDPLQVKEMEDHSTLYMLPEAFTRLDFLMHTPRKQTFQEAFHSFQQPDFSSDLTEDLLQLIAYYQTQDIDTIVVDQTAPEHRDLGFRCVKVILPGMLPMTFGYQHRRVHGFKRLTEWPVLLGYRTMPLAEAEINPHPHPFP